MSLGIYKKQMTSVIKKMSEVTLTSSKLALGKPQQRKNLKKLEMMLNSEFLITYLLWWFKLALMSGCMVRK